MQKKILEKLGLQSSENFLKDYFRIQLFAEYQGIDTTLLFKILALDDKPVFIPIRKFGVEIEAGIPVSRSEFSQIYLEENGVCSQTWGYSGSGEVIPRFKIGTDSSLSFDNGLEGIEVTSPPLIGMGNHRMGFIEVQKLLSIWKEVLEKYQYNIDKAINSSCGGHIHVDVWDLRREHIFNLSLIIYLFWDVIKFLVPPSRRNNRYCRAVDLPYMCEVFKRGGCSDRYFALNTSHLLNRKKHVEFRFWAGTLNPRKWRAHIVLSLFLVERAKEFWKSLFNLLKREKIEIEEFLEFVFGISSEKEIYHPILKDVISFLKERYHYFRYREEDIDRDREDFNFKKNLKEKMKSLYKLLKENLRENLRGERLWQVRTLKEIKKILKECFLEDLEDLDQENLDQNYQDQDSNQDQDSRWNFLEEILST